MYYVFVGSNAESFDLTTASGMPNRRQPLIQFTLGEYVMTINYFTDYKYVHDIHLRICTVP